MWLLLRGHAKKETFLQHLKELRNCISRIIRLCSLLCKIQVYTSVISTDSFGKLVFCLLALFALCKFDVTFNL